MPAEPASIHNPPFPAGYGRGGADSEGTRSAVRPALSPEPGGRGGGGFACALDSHTISILEWRSNRSGGRKGQPLPHLI